LENGNRFVKNFPEFVHIALDVFKNCWKLCV